ncbi:exo84 subunit/exocyst complex component [Amanita muscaria]
MQSLRTRRSERQAAPAKLTKAQDTPSRVRANSRVDDKIKKRLSMRYADISSPTHLVPPVPTISLPHHGSTRPHSPAASYEAETGDNARSRRTAKEDKRILDADDFDPNAFLKLKLANSTEAELKSLQSSLHTAKEDTARDLQRSVFKNYAEFVLISKEISTLENELAELKVMLSEYKSMPSQLNIPDPTTFSSTTLSTYRRSSVADLRIMYYNQMQTLHASIEGSAKFAPITSGRHIVSELDGVLSLNAATYRVTGKIKFVILDDAVLVARRRRRNNGNDAGGSSKTGSVGTGKLVAEHCWPVNEMLVLDTKDSSRITNVFKIRHGKETHVYRTEKPTEKKALLAQFRQVADELMAKKRKEREGEHERRKTMFQASGSGDRNVPPVPEWMADLTKRVGDIPGVGVDAKEKTERDTRWTNDWADQLTVAIALREWSNAVELVEKGQARLAVTPLLESKLHVLKSQLITALLEALSKPTIRKTAVITLISLLTRLNSGTAARNTLLRMRSQVIKSHIRIIRFEGNIGSYIGDLATVCFTGIKHSADWFLASFKENEVASSFIDWAKKELETYAEVFRKQVFTPDVDQKVVQEAVKITHAQSKKLLQEYGLDFSYLLNDLLMEDPKTLPKSDSNFSFSAHSRLSKHLYLSSTPVSVSDSDRSSTLTSTELPPALTFPAVTPPTSPPGTFPLSPGSSNTTTTSFVTLGNVYSPPATNGRIVFSIPSRGGTRTPVSAREPPNANGTYTSPLSSPALQNTSLGHGSGIPTSPLRSATPQNPSISGILRGSEKAGTVAAGANSPAGKLPPQVRALRSVASAANVGSTAPPTPARSTNRPSSRTGHRPPPVAVPRHDGMI